MSKKKTEEEVEKQPKFTKKQRLFIEAFVGSCACNISATCKKIGISRRCYYKWIDGNPEFKTAVTDGQEALIDLAETKLQQNIMEGKEQSIFFFLKTKGKSRGYVETIEQNVNVNPFEEAMRMLPDNPEKRG